MATFLNVSGLAVAFAAFVVILIQINYEQSFDKCHPTAERVFRVNLSEAGTFGVIMSRGFAESVIHSSPHIEAGTLFYPYIPPVYFTVQKDGEKQGFRETVQTCHPDMTKVFDFPFVEGDPACLAQPEMVIIPESLAQKIFGDESAVGKALHAEEFVDTKGRTDFTIGAVYTDFPDNTQLRNIIYTAIDPAIDLTNFESSNYFCYLLLDEAASALDVEDNFNGNFDFSKIGRLEEKIGLIPLTDIYYKDESGDGQLFRSGNREVTRLLFWIALLVIVVAIINFTNFSTALTPLRVKSINTQKVLGSSETTLRMALLAEAALISVVAWLVGLFLVYALNNASMLPFVEADLELMSNWPIVVLSGIIAVVTGILAGLYPSWYVTSFPLALVLKGSFGLSSSGRKLRTLLIGVQFIVSIALIIAAGFVRIQNSYMRNYSLGFDKDQVAIVELSGDMYNKHRDTYVNRLKDFPGIEEVAFSKDKVASKDGYASYGATYKEKDFQYFKIIVSPNFFRVMGIPVVEGRDFSDADQKSENITYIFNRVARVDMRMEAGDVFSDNWNPGRLAGFTDDIKFSSLRQGERYLAFAVGNFNFPMKVSYIRLKVGTDIHAAVEHIRKTMADIEPSYPFDIEFYDSIFSQLYHKEENLRSLITLFSLLAIALSLVGVFGLVVFDTQYRRKEIGIRRVHGATIREILGMLNVQYVYIVLVCFFVSAPLAWYGVRKWLESFAYKTPMYWWVYLFALLIVLGITVATVTFQSWRAANANPVNSLKSE